MRIAPSGECRHGRWTVFPESGQRTEAESTMSSVNGVSGR